MAHSLTEGGDESIDQKDLPPNKDGLSSGKNQTIEGWQKKLLPWFILMPTALIAVFIFLATWQMTRFNNALIVKADSMPMQSLNPMTPGTDQNQMRWITLVHLEQESYYRRYNQGSLLLMSRIYKQYLGFFTGMILAIVGAVFIIGKLREGSSSVSISTSATLNASLASSSPGIIFGVLGTLLMLTTMVSHNEIVVEDSPLYLNANAIMALDGPGPPNSQLDKDAIENILGDQAQELKNLDSLKRTGL